MAGILLPGDAGFADVLAGKKFSAGANYNGTGTMANNGAATLTPGASNVAIPAGYHNGAGIVSAVSVPAANVLTGTTIAGTAGTMPNRGAVTLTPSTVNQAIATGYHNGSGIVQGDANLTAANIKSGVSIFGIAGSVSPGVASASGTVTSAATGETTWGLTGNTGYPVNLPRITVTGLTFTPSRIVLMPNSNSSWQYYAYDTTTNYITGANYKWWMVTFVSTLYAVIADVTITATITSTGFILPVFSTSMIYKWYAYA